MIRKLLLSLVMLIGAVVGYGMYRDAAMPQRILQKSGIQFSEKPKLISRVVRNSGPFGSDQLEMAEFQLGGADVEAMRECNIPGFKKGSPDSPEFLGSLSKAPANMNTVCWKLISGKEEFLFVLFDDVIAYRLIIM